jgi:hypothetical protein
MTTLAWDRTSERVYQVGVDRGVLYLHDGTVAVWNGLINIEESTSSELKSYYLDGVKYLENLIPGDFSGKLTAFTYPDEFDLVNGVVNIAPGLDYYDQPAKSFNLSYRTRIGNDIEGTEYGYKLHILYNIIANPDSHIFATFEESGAQPIEFGWTLSGIPSKIKKFRPTVHISIDSTKTPRDSLKTLEDILYGTDVSDPHLPSIEEISTILEGMIGALIIVDHGDGTWSAIDDSKTYITMLDNTTFQIGNADATYLDATTYEISSPNIEETE